MKQGRSYFTVIVWILLAAIAAYFVYNVASSLYAPLMTATVTQDEAGAGYYASGFVVRAEEVVTSEYDTTVLACAEGAHVAANDVVATGYRSDDAKTRKTRSACLQVIRCLYETRPLCRQLLEKKRLPSGDLLAALHINDKLLERHRAYIIAGVLISRGGYEVLRDYLYGSEE